jgi:hypothetical protein
MEGDYSSKKFMELRESGEIQQDENKKWQISDKGIEKSKIIETKSKTLSCVVLRFLLFGILK